MKYLLTAVFCFLLGLVVSVIVVKQGDKEVYPPSYQHMFMQTCIAKHSELIEMNESSKLCSCAISRTMEAITFDNYSERLKLFYGEIDTNFYRCRAEN